MLPRTAVHLLAFAALATLAHAQTPHSAAERGGETLIVMLLAHAEAEDTLVRIDEVARLTGGNAKLRERVSKLDLVELSKPGECVKLTTAELKYRLLVAGLEAKQFRITGAPHVLVRRSREAVTERAILAAARAAVVQRWPGAAERVMTSPAEPILVPVLAKNATDVVRLEGVVRGATPPLGKVHVEVGVFVNDRRFDVVPVVLNVSLQPEQGADGLTRTAASAAAPAPNRDVPGRESAVLIKTRDVIKMIARLGPALATATGEALQEGRVGQSIRVRNVDSGKIVQGRVAGPGLVEVDY